MQMQFSELTSWLGRHIQAVETLEAEDLSGRQNRLQFLVSGKVLAVQIPAPGSDIETLLLVRHDSNSSCPDTDEYLNPDKLKILSIDGASLVVGAHPRKPIPRLRHRPLTAKPGYRLPDRGFGGHDTASTR